MSYENHFIVIPDEKTKSTLRWYKPSSPREMSRYGTPLIEQELSDALAEISKRKIDITNKTIFFLNGIEIKQELYKKNYNLKTTKDPEKADYIVFGQRHIHKNYWGYGYYHVHKNVLEICKKYHSKLLDYRNIMAAATKKQVLTHENALKLFRMSCSDDITNVKLLKTLVIDIDYNDYPLLVSILLRKTRTRASDGVFLNYYKQFMESSAYISIGNIYSNHIDLKWIIDNVGAKDLELVIGLFNEQIPDFQLVRKSPAPVVDETNKWDL